VATVSSFFRVPGGLVLSVIPYPTLKANLSDILTVSARSSCSSVLLVFVAKTAEYE
jgi:hypothetical protein